MATAPEAAPSASVTIATPRWSPSDWKVEAAEGKTRFHDLNLETSLLHAIADLGFQYCSPIQAQALPISLAGSDVIGRAQTGTGKTAAFLITLLDRMLKRGEGAERYASEQRALILAPTRELALQIAKDATALTKYTYLNVLAVVGGMDLEKQRKKLREEIVDIVVATPGRLLDFLSHDDVYLSELETLVIDEADRMLDMGFIPDVKRIIAQTPPKHIRQTLLFSATFTQDVLNLSRQWTRNAVTVEIEPENVATETVDQKMYITTTSGKLALLYNTIVKNNLERVMVFANRRDETRKLYEELSGRGLKCALLSGDVPQHKRIKTLENFRSGQIRVLVATDVAGRGIHIDGVTHVINYTLPDDPEDYVHRIGRTGRAGESGISISFACEDDAFQIPAIETLLGRKLETTQPDPDMLTPLPPRTVAVTKEAQVQQHRTKRPRGKRP
ncbi:MAG TPA: ATP-dependent RNA helicase RhlB [Pseudomonadales bacterium]|nr:ATP-dependent RNA helicase RhlB [Pseudomonadales bacterium]